MFVLVGHLKVKKKTYCGFRKTALIVFCIKTNLERFEWLRKLN